MFEFTSRIESDAGRRAVARIDGHCADEHPARIRIFIGVAIVVGDEQVIALLVDGHAPRRADQGKGRRIGIRKFEGVSYAVDSEQVTRRVERHALSREVPRHMPPYARLGSSDNAAAALSA